MPGFDIVVRTALSRSVRARQLEGMFDVPAHEKVTLRWTIDAPLDARPWQVGLITGPSGSGKSTIARRLFGEAVDRPLAWRGKGVIDDFDAALSMEEITGVCQAVGFNTIPAWLRPFSVLSNGERFRVELARRLVEGGALVVVDEFSSVVDRQVAKIASNAVQKFVRRRPKMQFVAVTCHPDVLDWLQPDWVIQASTVKFTWRALQRRPPIECRIGRVPYSAWDMFARYHYLTARLNRSAKCYALFVDARITTFAGLLKRPHLRTTNVYCVSRLVTLPDWQGIGLAMVLVDALGEAHAAIGNRLRTYPAHPSLVRAFDRSAVWAMCKRPGVFSRKNTTGDIRILGGRPCANFEYCGPPHADRERARALLSLENVS